MSPAKLPDHRTGNTPVLCRQIYAGFTPAPTQVYQANARLARIFAGKDPDYTVIGPWNSVAQLGAAVMHAFGLDPDYYTGDNLEFILSEGLAAVARTATAWLRAMAKRALDWEREVQPRLEDLGQFVVAVLLGTNDVLYPGRTLKDYAGPLTP